MSRVFSEEHAHCGDQQEQTEDVENEVKPADQRDAKQDHRAAHDQSADDSPDQDTMLCAGRNTKVREDQDEHKNVVHAQRVLDEVTGKKIDAVMWSFDTPDNTIEGERNDHPDEAAAGCCRHAQFTASQTKSEKIDPNRDEHANVKSDPEPNARRHSGQAFMRKDVRQSQIALHADATYTSRRHIRSHQWTLN